MGKDPREEVKDTLQIWDVPGVSGVSGILGKTQMIWEGVGFVGDFWGFWRGLEEGGGREVVQGWWWRGLKEV